MFVQGKITPESSATSKKRAARKENSEVFVIVF